MGSGFVSFYWEGSGELKLVLVDGQAVVKSCRKLGGVLLLYILTITFGPPEEVHSK